MSLSVEACGIRAPSRYFRFSRPSSLTRTLDEFVAMGFHSVGFSPLLRSPGGGGEMGVQALSRMLEGMIDCGLAFERAVLGGRRYPFLNMVNALREIHRGTHRPYPCGAGAGYFGVSADGDLAACHRFVDDGEGAMGDLETGVDGELQKAWLESRHVHFQEPCSRGKPLRESSGCRLGFAGPRLLGDPLPGHRAFSARVPLPDSETRLGLNTPGLKALGYFHTVPPGFFSRLPRLSLPAWSALECHSSFPAEGFDLGNTPLRTKTNSRCVLPAFSRTRLCQRCWR